MKQWVCMMLAWCCVSTGQAAQSNSVSVSMKVNIDVAPVCQAGLIAFTDGRSQQEVDFGDVYPHLIKDAPLSLPSLTEASVMDLSNFGGVYDQRNPTQTLKITCDLPPSGSSFKVSFIDQEGDLVPTAGAIDLFKLNNTDGNQDVLAFAVYAKDRHSSNINRINRFVKNSQTMTLFDDSFIQANSVYEASIDLYPGLFWISPTKRTYVSSPIESRISVSVTFN